MVYYGPREPLQRPPKYIRALLGGIAGMISTSIVHPLDLVKVRLQVYPQSTSTLGMVARIIRCEGPKSLYNGLSAGILRQATYTTTRLAVYYWLFEEYHHWHGTTPKLTDKVGIGVCAGMAGAFAGNPSEIALVRMMADSKSDPCRYCTPPFRHRYRGVVDALFKIIRDEGLCSLWRGGTLTVSRSVLISTAQISSYTLAHKALEERQLAKGLALHMYTSTISSFLTGILTLPLDHVKTIYQVNKDGLSQAQIVDDILKRKGLLYLWKGFLPYFVRMSAHTAMAYLVLEELSELYKDIYQNSDKKK